MNFELFHGSNEVIGQITAGGFFGGLFASSDEHAAISHGGKLHRITSPRHLSDFELNYEIEGAYEIPLELANGDEAIADAIMSKGCEVPDGIDVSDFGCDDECEMGLEIQRLRGVVASRLGYTSVEMLDEHGTTYLCLPGCTVEVVA